MQQSVTLNCFMPDMPKCSTYFKLCSSLHYEKACNKLFRQKTESIQYNVYVVTWTTVDAMSKKLGLELFLELELFQVYLLQILFIRTFSES